MNFKPLTIDNSKIRRSLNATFMLTKLLILSLNQNKEDWIMEYKFNGINYSILNCKFNHLSKYLLGGLLYLPSTNSNNRNKENKDKQHWTITRRKEMHNLCLRKDYKQSTTENRIRLKEEYFKSKLMLKTKK